MLILVVIIVKLTLTGFPVNRYCLWLGWSLLLTFVAILSFGKVFTIALFHMIKLFRNLLFRRSSPDAEPSRFDCLIIDSLEYDHRMIEVCLVAQQR